MSCRMIIEVSVTLPSRTAARRLENEFSLLANQTGTHVGVRLNNHYIYGDGDDEQANIPDTCGEVLENGTHVTYGMGDEKPIVLGEDTGDVAHGWSDSRECRSTRLWLARNARERGDMSLCSRCEIEDCISPCYGCCAKYQPCDDAGSGPQCAVCPHGSVSSPSPGSAGPVAGS